MRCRIGDCKNDAEIQGGGVEICMRHLHMMGNAHVVEVFHYTDSQFEVDAAFNGGADYPQYHTVLKQFPGKKGAEEYARTLTACSKPEPGGIAKIEVRPLRLDDVIE